MDAERIAKTLREKGWENVQTDVGEYVFGEASMAVENMVVEIEVKPEQTIVTGTDVETNGWQTVPLAAGTILTPTEAEAWIWKRYEMVDFE